MTKIVFFLRGFSSSLQRKAFSSIGRLDYRSATIRWRRRDSCAGTCLTRVNGIVSQWECDGCDERVPVQQQLGSQEARVQLFVDAKARYDVKVTRVQKERGWARRFFFLPE